jgi:Tol biopolymer transport system component
LLPCLDSVNTRLLPFGCIYIKNLKTGHINRATFTGRYNAKAVFSPNGKHLALVHLIDNDYRIAMLIRINIFVALFR